MGRIHQHKKRRLTAQHHHQQAEQHTTLPLLIQRALKNPNSETLTPDVVNALQSTHGNAFVGRLIQRSQTVNDGQGQSHEGWIQRDIILGEPKDGSYYNKFPYDKAFNHLLSRKKIPTYTAQLLYTIVEAQAGGKDVNFDSWDALESHLLDLTGISFEDLEAITGAIRHKDELKQQEDEIRQQQKQEEKLAKFEQIKAKLKAQAQAEIMAIQQQIEVEKGAVNTGHGDKHSSMGTRLAAQIKYIETELTIKLVAIDPQLDNTKRKHMLEDLKRELAHHKQQAEFSGESHSMQAKGAFM